MRAVLLTKYYSGDQIKQYKMGETCGTYGREERCYRVLTEKTSKERIKERDKSEDRGLDGRIILTWTFIHSAVCLTTGP
jgi:hypothetical protein